MDSSFKLLRNLGVIFKLVAWAALVFGLIGMVGVLMGGGAPGTPRGVSFIILLVSVLYFVIFYTVAEVIKLLLVLEERSRKTP